MSTTSLFVELLVIGAGGLVWVGLFVVAALGMPDLSAGPFASLVSSELVVLLGSLPLLGFTYVLGIVIDRLSDRVFRYVARWLSTRQTEEPFFAFQSKDEARRARTFLYDKSDPLRDLFEYGRSRLRVCRGWALNATLISLACVSFILQRMPNDASQTSLLMAAIVIPGLLVSGAVYAWAELLSNESSRLKKQCEQLGFDFEPANGTLLSND